MTKEELNVLINSGREIEFEYMKKMYSITYYNDKRERYISFCEFDKETTDVADVEELCNVERYGIKVIDMLNSIGDEDISVF